MNNSTGNNRESPFLDFCQELLQFALVQEKFPVAFGLVIVICSVSVLGYMHVDNKKLFPLNVQYASTMVAFPSRIDLISRPRKLDTCGIFLQQEILVGGTLIF